MSKKKLSEDAIQLLSFQEGQKYAYHKVLVLIAQHKTPAEIVSAIEPDLKVIYEGEAHDKLEKHLRELRLHKRG